MVAGNGSGVTVLLAGCGDVAGIGLRAVLSANPRFTIVGETRGDVVRQAQRHRPDVIVLDLVDSGRPNVALIDDLAERAPESRVCVYTNAFEPPAFLDAMLAGARAWVLKADADGAFVADTLALVGRYGATVIDPAVRARFEAGAGHHLRLMPDAPEEQRLSEREHAILRLLADGITDQAVAARLGISDSTVRSYVGRISTKLGATTREQLMVLAMRRGLLDG